MLEGLAQLIAPVTPHLGAELWELLGHKDRIDFAPWPKADLSKAVSDKTLYVIEVNGKLRAKIEWDKNADAASIEQLKARALKDEMVVKALTGRKVLKLIVVRDRIVNIVAK